MSKKKYLLPQVQQYFKANLHTHTNISDGMLSREETKQLYKEKGYQILCITDHNIIADHSDLNDEDFLMLTGTEVNINDPDMCAFTGKTYHLNLIAKKPDNLWCPVKRFGQFPKAGQYEEKMQCEEMDVQYDPESINAMIAKANEKGFLVTYNHPVWSGQSYPDYAPLRGLWGVELRNTDSYYWGRSEDNFNIFRELRNLGNNVFPIGADDMHADVMAGGAWIMVGAKTLTYEYVIDALEKGDFYMSCGPEIHSVYVEDNKLKVTCSDARKVCMLTHGRFARSVLATDGPIRSAEFNLEYFLNGTKDDPNAYICVTVIDQDGNYATTPAYYLKEHL